MTKKVGIITTKRQITQEIMDGVEITTEGEGLGLGIWKVVGVWTGEEEVREMKGIKNPRGQMITKTMGMEEVGVSTQDP